MTTIHNVSQMSEYVYCNALVLIIVIMKSNMVAWHIICELTAIWCSIKYRVIITPPEDTMARL